MEHKSFSIKIDQANLQKKSSGKKWVAVAALLFGVIGLAALYSPSAENASTNFLEVATGEEEVMKAYVNFIAAFGKQYGTKAHASKKYEVFKENYRKIQENNAHVKSSPFVMEVNQFADMTPQEFAAILGTEVPHILEVKTSSYHVRNEDRKKHHHSHHHHHSKNSSVTPLKATQVAQSINWFENGAVGEPKDQSACGSCWAFTTAGTLEALAHISGKFSDIPSFSMQQLLDCDTNNDGCDGGWMYKAYKYTSQNGIMHYDDYPYKGQANSDNCLYNETRVAFKNVGMVQEKNLGNNELKALLNKQPIGVGIYTNGNFQFYKTGVMTEDFLECSDPKFQVNHGVMVVGYGKTKADEKMSHWCEEYWIIRNSWGTKWGENGFFRLCMDHTGDEKVPYGTCQLNRFPTYPTMEPHPIEAEMFVE